MSKVTHSYEALLDLFVEFRELLKPAIIDGVPDFSSGAMAAQYEELQYLKKRAWLGAMVEPPAPCCSLYGKNLR